MLGQAIINCCCDGPTTCAEHPLCPCPFTSYVASQQGASGTMDLLVPSYNRRILWDVDIPAIPIVKTQLSPQICSYYGGVVLEGVAARCLADGSNCATDIDDICIQYQLHCIPLDQGIPGNIRFQEALAVSVRWPSFGSPLRCEIGLFAGPSDGVAFVMQSAIGDETDLDGNNCLPMGTYATLDPGAGGPGGSWVNSRLDDSQILLPSHLSFS